MNTSKFTHKPPAIFITGITSGIGFEILPLCLSQNFHITGLIRTESQREIFNHIPPKQLSLIVADLSNRDQVKKATQELINTHFQYILLNAACAKIGQFHHLPEESIDEIIETNLLSYMRLTHAFIPQAIKNETKFVFVSSLAARLPASNYATYATSKAALSKFVNSLKREYPTIRFLLAEIGPVDTPLHSKANNIAASKKNFKCPKIIARRLFKAMLNQTGTVTLSWEWSLLRRLAMIFEA